MPRLRRDQQDMRVRSVSGYRPRVGDVVEFPTLRMGRVRGRVVRKASARGVWVVDALNTEHRAPHMANGQWLLHVASFSKVRS